jgi:5'-3' exonuclease
MLQLLEEGATHVGIASDHVIPSFRNELYEGYKDGSGVEPELSSQYTIMEDLLDALGFTVFRMVEYEADDAMGAAARVVAADDRVEEVLLCTPDKDLGQCVGGKIFQLDRRKGVRYGVEGVQEKFGILPESIPDYLGLVGDSADGFPGLPGWGAKSAAAVLARYPHLEDIPKDSHDWDVEVRGASKLALTLHHQFDDALLFRLIATIDYDAPTVTTVEELEWKGPKPEAVEICERLDATGVLERAIKVAKSRT